MHSEKIGLETLGAGRRLRKAYCTSMEQTKRENLYRDEFLQRIFDAIPAFVFIVDEDVKLHFWNAPARQLVGEDSNRVYLKRGGEALHCIHSGNAGREGCGVSSFCRECIIRNAVASAFNEGQTRREFTRLDRWSGDTITEVYLLLTVSPFHYKDGDFALLLIEDVSHLLDEQEKEKPEPVKEEPAVTLSSSEREILKWLKQGKSSWAIARIMEMNMRTVNYHVYNIIGKLDAMNRTHAVAIALQRGLIHEND
jgi:DNA-binding CsgD family transcriptional regulator